MANAIHARRLDLCISFHDVAIALRRSQSMVVSWESEARFPAPHHQADLFAWLGWDEDQIKIAFNTNSIHGETEQLRQDIQAGLDSGEAAPLDMQAVKEKARQRRAERNQ